MRSWLAAVRAERGTAEIPEIPESRASDGLGGVSGISGIYAAASDWQERAAIIEFDGGVNRDLADALARMESTPSWCKAGRWRSAVNHFAGLIDDGSVALALEAGWDLVEIIGVQTKSPHDSPLVAGLVFSLRPGNRVEKISDRGCTIVAGSLKHVWTRTLPPATGSIVLPWDLAHTSISAARPSPLADIEHSS